VTQNILHKVSCDSDNFSNVVIAKFSKVSARTFNDIGEVSDGTKVCS